MQSVWGPRPRGDGWWSAKVIAARAPLLQISVHANISVPDQKAIGNTGKVVENLARLVAKNAFTLRTLASCVNNPWLIAK